MSPYAIVGIALTIAALAWLLYEAWRHMVERGVYWEYRWLLCGIAAFQLGRCVFWLIEKMMQPNYA